MEPASKAGHLMSLAALQQQDPYISRLLDVTGQVALYTFNSKTNEWEKTDIEGTLFVYARSASPYHGFTIMNRLSTENLVEPINKDLEFQLQDPFLLYRNANLGIYSIWFYDKKDCQRIAQLMVTIVKQEAVLAQRASPDRTNGSGPRPSGPRPPGSGPRPPGSGPRPPGPIDIMELLSKAKEEYHRTLTGEGDASVPTEQPGNADVAMATLDATEHAQSTPQPPEKSSHCGLKQITVEELFGTSVLKESPLPPSTDPAPSSADHAPSASYLQSYPPPAPFQPLLPPRLANDPGGHPALAPGLLPPYPPAPRPSLSPLLGGGSGPEPRPPPPSAAPPSSSSSSSSSYLGKELLSALKPPGSADLHKPTLAPSFLASPLVTPQSFREPISKAAHSALGGMAAPGPVQSVPMTAGADLSVLMSPSAFQQSVAKVTELPWSVAPPSSPPTSSGGAEPQHNACNKSQLQETLIHLLKTDPAFLSTIHDAYLQSLSRDLAHVQL